VFGLPNTSTVVSGTNTSTNSAGSNGTSGGNATSTGSQNNQSSAWSVVEDRWWISMLTLVLGLVDVAALV